MNTDCLDYYLMSICEMEVSDEFLLELISNEEQNEGDL